MTSTGKLLPSEQRVALYNTLSAELDRTIRDNAGQTLTTELIEGAIDRAQHASAQIGDRQTVAENMSSIASQLGLQAIRARLGVDGTAAQRNVGGIAQFVLGLPVERDVGAFAQTRNLKQSAIALLDELHAPRPELGIRIDMALRESLAALKTTVDRADGHPQASVETAQIKTTLPTELEDLKKAAWELYGHAKGSIQQENYGLARQQLDVAAAMLAKMHLLAKQSDNQVALNVAENRIGMVLHQMGQVAKALGRPEEQQSFDIKALAHYRKVLNAKDPADPPYHPAAAYNAACAFVQLGDAAEANAMLSLMLRACKDDTQRNAMRDVARNDAELQRDFSGDAGYRRLIA
jgi:hypothetical protein